MSSATFLLCSRHRKVPPTDPKFQSPGFLDRSPGLCCVWAVLSETRSRVAAWMWDLAPMAMTHKERWARRLKKNVSSSCREEAEEALLLAQYLRRKQAERELLEEREEKRLKQYLQRRNADPAGS